MRIRHYFASLAPPADQLPNDEEDAPRKKQVKSYDLIIYKALIYSPDMPPNPFGYFFWGTLYSFVRLL